MKNLYFIFDDESIFYVLSKHKQFIKYFNMFIIVYVLIIYENITIH